MKQIYTTTLMFLIFISNASSQDFIDFNLTTDLTTYFNPSQEVQIINGSSNGISNSGAADIPLDPFEQSENWTLKTGYPLVLDGIYEVSAYFKNSGNNGYGGLGFAINNTNTASFYGHPNSALGMAFHGGAGAQINNGSWSNVDWQSEFELNGENWYFIELTITYVSTNTFNIAFNIYDSDSNGVIGNLKTSHSFTNVTNLDLGGTTILYPYFSHHNRRFIQMDNFSSGTENNVLGTNEISSSLTEFFIYPNPSSEFIQISSLNTQKSYKIYNILGAEIKNGFISSNEQIDIREFTNGLFFLKFDNGNTIKFIKK